MSLFDHNPIAGLPLEPSESWAVVAILDPQTGARPVVSTHRSESAARAAAERHKTRYGVWCRVERRK